jgi:putative ABC transport system permease protein
MSFTVAERTRECGIRSALGAQPASIVAGIANRAFLQLAAGIAIGASLSALLLTEFDDLDGAAFRSTHWQLTLALIALSVLIIGMLACARPTLRALRIRPMDALKG